MYFDLYNTQMLFIDEISTNDYEQTSYVLIKGLEDSTNLSKRCQLSRHSLISEISYL